MKLSDIRALLTASGYTSTTQIDRFDVKRADDTVVGVDLMFTDGTVAYLPTPSE